MVIGVVTASLSLPEARSLKDKRRLLRSMRDRVANKMNVSIAEVGKQDVWKSSEFAFVTVAASKSIVDKRVSELSTILRSDPRYVLIDLHTSVL